MPTITFTTTAWISHPQSFCARTAASATGLSISDSDMTAFGWVRVGPAAVTIEAAMNLADMQVMALREQQRVAHERAERTTRELGAQIEKVLSTATDDEGQLP